MFFSQTFPVVTGKYQNTNNTPAVVSLGEFSFAELG